MGEDGLLNDDATLGLGETGTTVASGVGVTEVGVGGGGDEIAGLGEGSGGLECS